MVVDIFVAVPFAARNPPGFGVTRNVELGQLLVDLDIGKLLLVGEGEAKSYAAVEDPRDQVDAAFGLAEFGDGYADFAIVVAHHAVLAPGLFPLAFMVAPHRFAQRHAIAPFARTAQQEAQAGEGDHWFAVAGHRVMRRFRHRLEREAQPPVRGTFPITLRILRSTGHGQGEDDQRHRNRFPNARHHHPLVFAAILSHRARSCNRLHRLAYGLSRHRPARQAARQRSGACILARRISRSGRVAGDIERLRSANQSGRFILNSASCVMAK